MEVGYAPSHSVPDSVGIVLLKTGATSEATAVPLVHLNHIERRQLARLIRRGVILEGRTSGRYYVDAERLHERARVRLKFAIAAIVFVIALMVVAVLYAK